MLQNTESKFDAQLQQIIACCNKVYPERTTFLDFIVNEIKYLKAKRDRKNSFNAEELAEYKKQIALMLIDFRQLLLTTKGETCKVRYSVIKSQDKDNMQSRHPVTISISGLVNDAYVGNHFCNSGFLLNNEVLGRVHIDVPDTRSLPSSAEEIEAIAQINAIAEDLCTEQQNTLLIGELKAQNLLLETKVSSLNHTSGLQEAELLAAKEKYSAMIQSSIEQIKQVQDDEQKKAERN